MAENIKKEKYCLQRILLKKLHLNIVFEYKIINLLGGEKKKENKLENLRK